MSSIFNAKKAYCRYSPDYFTWAEVPLRAKRVSIAMVVSISIVEWWTSIAVVFLYRKR